MDLNADGYVDILTGSWPGELHLFLGNGNNTHAASETIRDKDGLVINPGGGTQERSDGTILITGTADFEDTPEGKTITYQGTRLVAGPDTQISTTGTASAAHAADWDGDGDYDLLVGDIGGNVFLVNNEGTATAFVFGKESSLHADGQPLKVARQAGPFTADWDGDGDLDLLVGDGDGRVSLFRNRGTATSSDLDAAEELVPPGTQPYGQEVPKEAYRGVRAKVCATDWNGDGRLDLLLGDFSREKLEYPDLTSEEKAEHVRIRKELKQLNQRSGKLYNKLSGSGRVENEKKREKVGKEWLEINNRQNELRSKLPPEYTTHGWVWLFLRK
ncbi:MAG: VCBS repeat-containing protein [bacterium]|nr:VCBS repeat-containing protein [bacterium]